MSSRSPATKKMPSIFWVLVVFLFFSVPPAAIILLVLYFTGAIGKRRPSAPPVGSNQHLGARTGTIGGTAARASRPKQAAQLLQEMQAKAKKMTVIAGVFTGIFGIALAGSLANSLFWLTDGHVVWFLEDMMAPLCLFAIPFALLLVGLHRRRDVRRFRTYLAMVGNRDTVSISSLAAAAGVSQAKVLDVLEDMLDAGLFPAGYLDLGSGQLIVSGQGVSDTPKEPPKPKPEADPHQAMLMEIRTVRADIDNGELCVKIDRIADITARILDYRQDAPDKAPQLHSFLNYYLPTTLKILRAYAKLENQQVSGENITAAMTRIEGMMDKIVEGFEKQLDQLFQGDALDIASDVAVLERMLAKDGLSASPLNLDGSQ